jgi:hypothetical protein
MSTPDDPFTRGVIEELEQSCVCAADPAAHCTSCRAISEITRLRQDLSTAIERAAVVAETFQYVVPSKTKTTVSSFGKTVPIMTLMNEPEIVRGIASSIRSLKTESSNG